MKKEKMASKPDYKLDYIWLLLVDVHFNMLVKQYKNWTKDTPYMRKVLSIYHSTEIAKWLAPNLLMEYTRG